MIQQFIGAFLVASAIMVGGSFLWPVVMKSKRPPLLEAVHEKALETQVGRQADNVLGAYISPDGIGGTVNNASNQVIQSIGTGVQNKVEDIVTQRLVEEVVRRLETMDTKEKQQIQTVICQPAKE